MRQADIAQDSARRLRDCVRRLIITHGVLEEARRPCGSRLTMPHAYALLELLNSGAPMTVSELADKLTIDRTNVSRLCIRMERDGELERTTAPHDQRARALLLTAHGRQIAVNVEQASLRHFNGIAARLGGSAGAVIHAIESLEQAMAGLKEENVHGEDSKTRGR